MFLTYLGSGVFVKEGYHVIAKRGRSKPTVFSLAEKGCLVSLMRDISSVWDLRLKKIKMHRHRRKISISKKA